MTFRYIDDNSITSTEAKSINVSITARTYLKLTYDDFEKNSQASV